ncbi:serine/threonine-protein kinase [Candidatus Uabimicrobium sp. HlEnr_7]|uniref:serine/threonine-protein kinase n=1 Tax=Candidatus Uabimicrobium helgolandensis TaxID=3095367 RepID=UPI003556302B
MLIKDRYEIIQKLGAGASSEVFLARDTVSQRPVAIKKIILRDNKEVILMRLQREYSLLSQIRHPNILCAYDYFIEKDCFFMITEYIKGCTLEELIEKYKHSLSFYDRLVVAIQLARSVEVINTLGIVHRDIKPPNIMLDSVNRLVKILDLGTGKKLNSEEENARVTKAGTVVGTPSYMSPEQIKSEIYENTDVFSCAITLYQFFSWSEQSPFERKNLLATLNAIANEKLPPLNEVIHTTNNEERQIYLLLGETLSLGLIKDPEQRIGISNFAKQIQEALEKYNMLRMLASGVHGHTWEPGQALSNQEREKLKNLREKYGEDQGIRKRKQTTKPKVPVNQHRPNTARINANRRLSAKITSTQRIAKQKALSQKEKQQAKIIYSLIFVGLIISASVFFYRFNLSSTKVDSPEKIEKVKKNPSYFIDDDVKKLVSLTKDHRYTNVLKLLSNIQEKSPQKYDSSTSDPLTHLIVALYSKNYSQAHKHTRETLKNDYHGLGLYLSIQTFALNGDMSLAKWYSGVFVENYSDFYNEIKNPAIDLSLSSIEAYNKWKIWEGPKPEKSLYKQYMILAFLSSLPKKIDWKEIRKRITEESFKHICDFLYYSSRHLEIPFNERYQKLKHIAQKLPNLHYPFYNLLLISNNQNDQLAIRKKIPHYKGFYPIDLLLKTNIKNVSTDKYKLNANSEMLKRALCCAVIKYNHYDKIDSLIQYYPEALQGYTLKLTRSSISLKILYGFLNSNLGNFHSQHKKYFINHIEKAKPRNIRSLYWNLERIKVIHQRTASIINSSLSVRIEKIEELQSILTKKLKSTEKTKMFYSLLLSQNWKALEKVLKKIKQHSAEEYYFYKAVYQTERLYYKHSIAKKEHSNLVQLQTIENLFSKTQLQKSKWRNHGLFLLEYINPLITYYKKNHLLEFQQPKAQILKNMWFTYVHNHLHNLYVLREKATFDLKLQPDLEKTRSYLKRATQYLQINQHDKMQRDFEIARFIYPLFHYHSQEENGIKQSLEFLEKQK